MDITTNAPKGASFHFQDDEANKKILFSIFHFLEIEVGAGRVCGICVVGFIAARIPISLEYVWYSC